MDISFPTLEILLFLIASYINLTLCTLEMGLVVRYFKRPDRPQLHRAAVGIMLAADTLCTLALCANVAVQALVPRTPENARRVLAPLSVTILTTYVSATIEQLFLCQLFYSLTRNRIVSMVIISFVVIHVSFSWASAVLTVVRGSALGIALTTTIVGTSTCAATDIAIASALSWRFWTMMEPSPFQVRDPNARDPDSAGRTGVYTFVHRTFLLTVCSGAIVASTTLVIMLLLLTNSLGFIFVWSCQGRIYALTLLGNFLIGIPHHHSRLLGRARLATLNLGVSKPVFHVGTVTDVRDDLEDEPNGAVEMVKLQGIESSRRTSLQGRPTSSIDTALPRASHVSMCDLPVEMQNLECGKCGLPAP